MSFPHLELPSGEVIAIPVADYDGGVQVGQLKEFMKENRAKHPDARLVFGSPPKGTC